MAAQGQGAGAEGGYHCTLPWGGDLAGFATAHYSGRISDWACAIVVVCFGKALYLIESHNTDVHQMCITLASDGETSQVEFMPRHIPSQPTLN